MAASPATECRKILSGLPGFVVGVSLKHFLRNKDIRDMTPIVVQVFFFHGDSGPKVA